MQFMLLIQMCIKIAAVTFSKKILCRFLSNLCKKRKKKSCLNEDKFKTQFYIDPHARPNKMSNRMICL